MKTPSQRLFRLTIYLRGGASFTVLVEDYKATWDRIEGKYSEINWTTAADNGPRLRGLDPTEIVAILDEAVQVES